MFKTSLMTQTLVKKLKNSGNFFMFLLKSYYFSSVFYIPNLISNKFWEFFLGYFIKQNPFDITKIEK